MADSLQILSTGLHDWLCGWKSKQPPRGGAGNGSALHSQREHWRPLSNVCASGGWNHGCASRKTRSALKGINQPAMVGRSRLTYDLFTILPTFFRSYIQHILWQTQRMLNRLCSYTENYINIIYSSFSRARFVD